MVVLREIDWVTAGAGGVTALHPPFESAPHASVSFVQNYKVEKLMVSFLDYIPKEVVLLRDGEKVLLDAQDVVPGAPGPGCACDARPAN